jgi:O-antigen ligase
VKAKAVIDRYGQGRLPDPMPLLLTYVVVAIAIPSRLVFGPLGAAGTPAQMVAMGAFALWVLIRVVHRGHFAAYPQPVRWALLAFAVAMLASYLAAMTRPILTTEISSADRGMLSICAWCGIAMLTADGVRSRDDLDRLLKWVAVAGIGLAALGIFQFFTGQNPVGDIKIPGLSLNQPLSTLKLRSDFRRVTGTTIHPIEFGVVLSMILPVVVHFALHGRRKRLWWAGVIVIGAALPMPVARSAVVATGVAFIIVFLGLKPQHQRRALLILPVFLVIMRIMIPGLLGTIRSLFSNFGNDPSISGRTQDYAAVLHYFSLSPLFGRGFSTFIPSIYRTLDNQYLGMLVEGGIIGVGAMIVLLFTGALSARAVRRVSPLDADKSLGQALCASILAAAISFGTFDALGFPMCAAMLFLFIGCAGALWRHSGGLKAYLAEGAVVSHRRAPLVRLPVVPRALRVTLVMLLAVAVVGVADKGSQALLKQQRRYQAIEMFAIANPGPKALNPYDQAQTDGLPDSLVAILTSTTAKSALARAGGSTDFTIAQGNGSLAQGTDVQGGGPMLTLSVVAPTRQSAALSRTLIMNLAVQTATRLQDDVHPVYLVPNARLGILPLQTPPPFPVHGSAKRSLAALTLILALALAGAYRLLRRFAFGAAAARRPPAASRASVLSRQLADDESLSSPA